MHGHGYGQTNGDFGTSSQRYVRSALGDDICRAAGSSFASATETASDGVLHVPRNISATSSLLNASVVALGRR